MALTVAFDFDGTAFEFPNDFRRLMLTLQDALAYVFIFTDAAREFPPHERQAEVKRLIRFQMGSDVDVKIEVFCCEEKYKARILEDRNVDIVVTDRAIDGWSGLQLIPFKR
jgi:hypothetical protein